jgi:hypothetical protein
MLKESLSPTRDVVHARYGPSEVLRLEEVERPIPKDDEVVVRISSTVCEVEHAAWDARERIGDFSNGDHLGRLRDNRPARR